MARPSPYDEKTRAEIIKAAVDARNAGKKWEEAHAAATEAGYKGGLQYLMKMIRSSGAGGIKRRGRRGHPGRPPGAGASRRGRPAGGAGLGSIQSIVDRMVEERVRKVLDGAIASLERASSDLKRLR